MVNAAFVPLTSVAHLSNGGYGIGIAYAKSTDKVYSVACTIYDSSTCLVPGQVKFPIPAGTKPPSGSDHGMTVIYQAMDGSPYAGMELDCWVAQYDAANDTWSCGTASITHIINGWGTCAESNVVGYHCNGGDAAGINYAAGAIRPEEIAAGNIPHALAVSMNIVGTGIACPGTHTDSSGPGLPEGAHFFLPKSYNVDAQQWPDWVKVIAKALQNYGGYEVDFSGNFEIRAFADDNAAINGTMTWSQVGVPVDEVPLGNKAWLNMIPWDQMQVESIQWCN
jgi:hypothetical protein